MRLIDRALRVNARRADARARRRGSAGIGRGRRGPATWLRRDLPGPRGSRSRGLPALEGGVREGTPRRAGDVVERGARVSRGELRSSGAEREALLPERGGHVPGARRRRSVDSQGGRGLLGDGGGREGHGRCRCRCPGGLDTRLWTRERTWCRHARREDLATMDRPVRGDAGHRDANGHDRAPLEHRHPDRLGSHLGARRCADAGSRRSSGRGGDLQSPPHLFLRVRSRRVGPGAPDEEPLEPCFGSQARRVAHHALRILGSPGLS